MREINKQVKIRKRSLVAQTQRVCSGLEQHSSLILIFFSKCVAFQGSP